MSDNIQDKPLSWLLLGLVADLTTNPRELRQQCAAEIDRRFPVQRDAESENMAADVRSGLMLLAEEHEARESEIDQAFGAGIRCALRRLPQSSSCTPSPPRTGSAWETALRTLAQRLYKHSEGFQGNYTDRNGEVVRLLKKGLRDTVSMCEAAIRDVERVVHRVPEDSDHERLDKLVSGEVEHLLSRVSENGHGGEICQTRDRLVSWLTRRQDTLIQADIQRSARLTR